VATVFISYRRDDTQQACGRIRERLVDQYGSDSVFLDIEDIGYGRPFLQEIERAISQCDVFLLLIGPRWLNEANKARLFETTDVVRMEVETALSRGLTIIPVLIDRAPFPTREQLPETLQPILSFNAAPIDSGLDFGTHVGRLFEQIESVTQISAEQRQRLTLTTAEWRLSAEPTKDAMISMHSTGPEGLPVYAMGLSSRRVLRTVKDPEHWISFAKVPADIEAKCVAIADRKTRGSLWVGTTGHLFRLASAGSDWLETEYFAGLGERGVRSIGVNPANPAHVLVGTGQYWSGASSGAATLGGFSAGEEIEALGESNWKEDPGYGDLHVTRDGGASWRTGPFKNVNEVLLADADPGIVFVATADYGLFVSSNGGASFRLSPGTNQYTLWSAAVSPHDFRLVVLGTSYQGVLISRDCGQSWSRPGEIGEAEVHCAAFSRDDPNKLIVGSDEGVFISKDGGATFQPENRSLVHRRVLSAASDGARGFVIGTDGGGIYARSSSGKSWHQVYRGLTRCGVGALHFDDTDTLYVAGEGLLCRTEDFGKSFQQLHHVLSTIRAIGVFRSPSQQGVEPAVSWNQNDTYIIGTEDGEIHRSGDYGENWECVLKESGLIRKVEQWAAGRSSVVLAVAQTRALYKSEDGGGTWREFGGSDLLPTTFATLQNDRRMLVGTFKRGVLLSDDDGSTWSPMGAGLPSRPVTCLYPSSGDRWLAGLQQGGLWRYGGESDQWVRFEGVPADESINDITTHGQRILLATNRGALLSMDDGANWTDFSEGMSNIKQVTRIALSRDGRTVFCGEVGGLYGRLLDS
jgi:photosystem II stability/assembly factor-like uncharacterized protein